VVVPSWGDDFARDFVVERRVKERGRGCEEMMKSKSSSAGERVRVKASWMDGRSEEGMECRFDLMRETKEECE